VGWGNADIAFNNTLPFSYLGHTSFLLCYHPDFFYLEQQLTYSADVGLIGLAVMVSRTLLDHLACAVADVVPFYIHLSNPFYSTSFYTYHYAYLQTYRVRT